jgi:hypothetical protein
VIGQVVRITTLLTREIAAFVGIRGARANGVAGLMSEQNLQGLQRQR